MSTAKQCALQCTVYYNALCTAMQLTVHCNALCTATHYALQRTVYCNALCTATHCVLQCTVHFTACAIKCALHCVYNSVHCVYNVLCIGDHVLSKWSGSRCVCARARARVCAYVCVCVCVWALLCLVLLCIECTMISSRLRGVPLHLHSLLFGSHTREIFNLDYVRKERLPKAPGPSSPRPQPLF